MNAPDRGNAIGRSRQLRSHFGIFRCPALQRQQAYDHLQAVQQPMIGLLAQHRLLLDQLVLLTKQSLFPGESLVAARFRAPVSYQLAFVARDRAALAIFKNDIQGNPPLTANVRWSFCRSFPCPDFVAWTPRTKINLRPRQASHIDRNQSCPIPDIDFYLGRSPLTASFLISAIKPARTYQRRISHLHNVSFVFRPICRGRREGRIRLGLQV